MMKKKTWCQFVSGEVVSIVFLRGFAHKWTLFSDNSLNFL